MYVSYVAGLRVLVDDVNLEVHEFRREADFRGRALVWEEGVRTTETTTYLTVAHPQHFTTIKFVFTVLRHKMKLEALTEYRPANDVADLDRRLCPYVSGKRGGSPRL